MRRSGFSIIELVIVIALTAAVFAMTSPFLTSFRSVQTLRTVSDDVFRTMVVARHRSQSNERNTTWGVKMLSNAYVLYAGDSYANRNAAFDESQQISPQFQFGGLSEVSFLGSTGKPLVSGTITITQTPSNSVKTITVNSAGGLTLE